MIDVKLLDPLELVAPTRYVFVVDDKTARARVIDTAAASDADFAVLEKLSKDKMLVTGPTRRRRARGQKLSVEQVLNECGIHVEVIAEEISLAMYLLPKRAHTDPKSGVFSLWRLQDAIWRKTYYGLSLMPPTAPLPLLRPNERFYRVGNKTYRASYRVVSKAKPQ